MNRCIFFDRDGVINRPPSGDYILSINELQLSRGIESILRLIRARHYLAIVVTSQKCVGKGLIDVDQLDRIHASMEEQLRSVLPDGFDAIYAHTGLPGSESWAKPNADMILQAADEHWIDLEASWMIGDQDRDIAMAQAAGVGATVRLRGDRELTVEADYTCDSLDEVQRLLDQKLSME